MWQGTPDSSSVLPPCSLHVGRVTVTLSPAMVGKAHPQFDKTREKVTQQEISFCFGICDLFSYTSSSSLTFTPSLLSLPPLSQPHLLLGGSSSAPKENNPGLGHHRQNLRVPQAGRDFWSSPRVPWSSHSGLCPEGFGTSPGRRLQPLSGLCSRLGTAQGSSASCAGQFLGFARECPFLWCHCQSPGAQPGPCLALPAHRERH